MSSEDWWLLSFLLLWFVLLNNSDLLALVDGDVPFESLRPLSTYVVWSSRSSMIILNTSSLEERAPTVLIERLSAATNKNWANCIQSVAYVPFIMLTGNSKH